VPRDKKPRGSLVPSGSKSGEEISLRTLGERKNIHRKGGASIGKNPQATQKRREEKKLPKGGLVKAGEAGGRRR